MVLSVQYYVSSLDSALDWVCARSCQKFGESEWLWKHASTELIFDLSHHRPGIPMPKLGDPHVMDRERG